MNENAKDIENSYQLVPARQAVAANIVFPHQTIQTNEGSRDGVTLFLEAGQDNPGIQ